jgi:diacylglycerol kinase family enzyme
MQRPPSLFIVLNAGSGRRDTSEARETIGRVLEEAAAPDHRVMQVDRAHRLPALAREAALAARRSGGIVVAAGGDGTVNPVAQAAPEHDVPLGVLPLGTVNNLCRVHGIPDDLAEATRLLLSGSPRPVQAGLVNGRLFLVSASLGLYPQVIEDREAWKRRYGRSRAVAMWAGLLTLMQAHRPLKLDLHSHGTARRLRTPTLFVGNNALQLAQLGIAEAAALADGELAAIALQPVGTASMLWLMLRGALGQLGDARNVTSFSFEDLIVRPAAPLGTRPMKVAVDGELLWLRAPLTFRAAPHALRLVQPPAAPAPTPDATP